MKIKYYNNTDIKKEIEISSVNIFYGYSGSGKTSFSKMIEEGLLGKDKSFSINGSNIIKDELNVVYLDSKESIQEHLKLSSKSYLKKLYHKPIYDYLLTNENILDNINEEFKDINNTLQGISDKFNNRSSINKLSLNFKLPSIDTLINECVNVSLEEEITSSQSRQLLFNLITLLDSTEKESHIIIDNFDSFLDEEAIICFFNLIKDFNGKLYLFTNKPSSLMYAINNFSIFNIRNNNLYNLSNIEYLITNSISETEHSNYIDYMLNTGYIKNSGELSYLLNTIINNSICNLGRMLTSRNYKIVDKIRFDCVPIIPNNENERKFLESINNLINND